MNTEKNLSVLVLNASLKHGGTASNTEEVAELVLENMRKLAPLDAEIVRLADQNIPVGLGFKESEDDEWPGIAKKIREADIVIFATPVWWGQRSSLMQRVMERLDAFDEESIKEGRSALLNKVAGVVVTGTEDGAQQVLASLMEVLTFMNFTLPPQCCTYWVGEVGMDPATEGERRRENKMVGEMAKKTAQGLVYYAKLLKEHPMAS